MSYKYAPYGRVTEREGRKSAKLALRFRCHGSFPTPIAATPPPYQLPGLGKQRYKNGRISVSTRGGWVNKSVVSGRKIFSAETLGRERWNTRLSIQFLLGTLLSFGRSLEGEGQGSQIKCTASLRIVRIGDPARYSAARNKRRQS